MPCCADALQGFWWAHMGWFADGAAAVERPMLDHSNVPDLTSQVFYRFLAATWFPQLLIRHALTQYFGGLSAVVWTLAFPTVWGWHVTFLVNSAAHIWGRQPYNTGGHVEIYSCSMTALTSHTMF